MLSYNFFYTVILLSLLSPIAALIIIICLGFLEREVDFLEMENKRVLLEKELHQTEYLQLSQQIEPHFLFNTLNAILTLGRLGRLSDIVHALEKLSLFFRYSYMEKEPLVSFEQELKHTQNYLAIQQIRFGEKLKVEYLIDPLGKLTVLPPYALQTLVENAFKHGLARKTGEKRVAINLNRQGNWVSLSVVDNGPGQGLKEEPGIGLKNLEKRFALAFSLPSEITITRKDNLTEAKIVWPYTPEVEKE